MRITCDACNAQYNLPDEKVRGRRVKVRCKRCSEGIIVDGTQLVEHPAPSDFEDEATRVMDSPLVGGNMWTVNLSEDEQGDMTDEELVAGWQAGVVTEDAYVWRDGMDDWAAVLDVPELVSLLATVPRPTPAVVEAPEPPPPSEPVRPVVPLQPAAEPFSPEAFGGGGPASGRGALSLPNPPPLAAPVAPRAAASPFDDLFGEPPKPAAARREKPRAAAATAREENSVLFSLDALKQAAAPTNAAGPAAARAPLSGRASEDILTMGGPTIGGFEQAPLIQVDAPPPPPPEPVAAYSSMPAAGAIGAAGAPAKSRRGLFAALALTALVAGGGAVAATQLLSGDKPPETAARSGEVTNDDKNDDAEGDDKKNDAEGDDKKDDAEGDDKKDDAEGDDKNDDAEDDDKKDDAEDDDKKASGSSTKRSTSSGSRSPSRTSTSSGSKTSSSSGSSKSPSTKETKKVEPAEVDLGGGSSVSAFSTQAARASLSAAAANAKSCAVAGGASGKGKVQVTFVPSGRVTSANVVAGPFGGTPVGGCVARTFRSARVPKFSGAPVTVAKSFSIPQK